ncbi:MAG: RND family transporter [Myxococcota bacterium]
MPHSHSESVPRESWQARSEAVFERWGRFIVRQKWPALILSVAVTGWLLSYLPGLTIDNSTEAFLLPDDPAVIEYNAFRDQFGRDDRLIVAIRAPDLFAPSFLERLRALHERIEAEIPYVDEVDSLLNARVTRGDDEGLIVEDLLEPWPETDAELRRIRDYALANPLYKNTLISGDGHVTGISIKPFTFSPGAENEGEEGALSGFDVGGGDSLPTYLTAPEGDALILALRELIDELSEDGFEMHLAGAMAMTYRINIGMTRDMSIFLPMTLLLMCVVLALLFRRIGGVVLPLLVVVLSLTATLGLMIWLEIPGSTAVQILPVFLLTVGVCDAVHILAIAYRLRMEGASQEDSIAVALGHSGLAILMTSVTTAAGMASFVTAEMAAVMHLGILAPIGVGLAFVYTLVLLPAMLAIFPFPVPKRGAIGRGAFPFERELVAAGTFAARSPWRILLPTSLLLILAIMGALQTSFTHNGLNWFPQDDWVVQDFRAIDEAMGGSVSLEVLVDAREPGGLYQPELLEDIKRLGEEITHLAADPLRIGDTMSIVEVVEETHQALNENRPEMRRIPETRAAVAQELLLFENSGSDDTEELVDSEYRLARLNLRVPFVDALAFPPFLKKVRTLVAKRLGDRADFELTGLMMLLSEIFGAVIVSMARSYAFAIAVITPLMMILLGSLRQGLVSMVPNLLPILSVLGVMGWMGMALDTTTMMIGALVIGIAVDDTIHFMHKFRRYYEVSGDLEEAVAETLRTTGSALLFTSLVLMAGFAIFGFSEMSNIRTFGLFAAFSAGVAFLADLLVAPALLSVVERYRAGEAVAPESR